MQRVKQSARALAWFAMAGQVAFVLSWIVAGALEPGYSHLEYGVSALGSESARHPWIVNAGTVLMGLSIAALGPGVLSTLPRRRARVVAALLFALAGLAFALGGLFQLDCPLLPDSACAQRSSAGLLSTEHYLHLWLGLAFDVLFLATPFTVARALWGRPSGAAALAAGVFGLAVFAAIFAGHTEDSVLGLMQRLGFLAVHAWAFLVAAGILHETRRQPAFGESSGMPPREFFRRSWSGDGEIVFFPALLWRRFPLRFRCRREATWLSDDVWYYDDQVVMGDGRVETRRRFCQFVAPDLVHVTADDMPDGAEMALGENGFRIAPFWWVVPIGPVRWPLRCREQSRMESDGTFVETFHLRSFGLPAGRMTFRVRPEGGA
jgi:hypothetical protein